MSVDSLLKKRLVTIKAGDTVVDATRRMTENEVGAVAVVEGDRFIGIFSERDLVNRVVSAGKDPNRTVVRDVATLNPVMVSTDASVADCYRLFKEGGFRHLPVVDGSGVAIGMISSRDLLKFMTVTLEERLNVGEVFRAIGAMRIDIYGD